MLVRKYKVLWDGGADEDAPALTVYLRRSGGFRQHLQELLGLRLCGFGRHQREPRRL